jgi:transposase-like protein
MATHDLSWVRPAGGRKDAFDLDAFRRQRFADGRFCPHCEGRRVHRWGWAGDRRRYHCLACRRTFNDLTGTPLAYLKRLDRWPSFCDAVLESWSVRRTAAGVGISVSTAFRWRHRLLDALRVADDARLWGDVVLAETWFAFSEKGRRDLERPGRRRGEYWPAQRAWLLLARDARSRPLGVFTGVRRPRVRELRQALAGRLEPDINLHDGSGPLGQVAYFAREQGLGYRRLRRGRLSRNPATAYGVAFRRWLWPFNGVATRYLPNYLTWHRFLVLSARHQPAA